jgi:hypothetical protein
MSGWKKKKSVNDIQAILEKNLFNTEKEEENLLEERPLQVNEIDSSQVKTWKTKTSMMPDKD